MNMDGAAEQARLLDHGWIGPEHFLLAAAARPGLASEALSAVGIRYEGLLQQVRSRGHDRDLPPPPRAGDRLRPNPAGHQLIGWARGFAAATGAGQPRSEHVLLALLSQREPDWLQPFGVTARAVADALAERGVPVPAGDPRESRPWRGVRNVSVALHELRPVIDLLAQRHPPGSEWRWGFNQVGDPPRGRVSAEEGIDLDAVVAEVRSRHG